MGLSQKDLYNNALQTVSRRRISTINDGSYEANLCNDLFPRVLDNTLYEHNWGSCMNRVALTPLSDAPTHAYTVAYQLPNDCVRVIQAYYDDSKDSFDFEWEIQGRTLITNQGTVYLKYVQRPTSFEALNSAIIECLIYKLAIALSIPLQLNRADATNLTMEYEQKVLPRAKALDSQESRYLEFEENPWIESLYNESPQI